jgi:wyosine [tRNA(Phe)-imidazoG37] synthetase (radical SAM superfamily)
MKTVYGPVSSWRLGKSLGVDLISTPEKICSFDCVYCQLGMSNQKTIDRTMFVETEKMQEDLLEVLPGCNADVDIDIITFSGMGEPTLAANLSDAIEIVKMVSDLPIAILTNASLFYRKEVRNSLAMLDKVVAKLDAPNEEIFYKINQPAASVSLEKVFAGLKKFRSEYKGKGEFDLQMMFIEENKGYGKELAALAAELEPDEVQINTPLRPCPVKPLSRREIEEINRVFEEKGLNSVTVYRKSKSKLEVKPVEREEVLLRRKIV